MFLLPGATSVSNVGSIAIHNADIELDFLVYICYLCL